ncbi:MAG TPA: hypothetical protein VHC42_05425 [Rhizomicrobium sp.]|nr:hypothetical protein [Rhizomicrobium sp.]
MKRLVCLTLVAGLACVPIWAWADDPIASAPSSPAVAVQPEPAAKSPVSDADAVVCRTLAPKTGSRLGARRVCLKQREWDDMMYRAQKELMRDQKRGCNGSSCN